MVGALADQALGVEAGQVVDRAGVADVPELPRRWLADRAGRVLPYGRIEARALTPDGRIAPGHPEDPGVERLDHVGERQGVLLQLGPGLVRLPGPPVAGAAVHVEPDVETRPGVDVSVEGVYDRRVGQTIEHGGAYAPDRAAGLLAPGLKVYHDVGHAEGTFSATCGAAMTSRQRGSPVVR